MYPSSSNESKRSQESNEDNRFFKSNTKCNSKSTKPFKFPPPPGISKSLTNTSQSTLSDSSMSDGQIIKNKRKNRRKGKLLPPPIGVFWDIENCHVPKNKSASTVAQRIREFFFDGYREAEFLVVCDVKKENSQVIQDLNDAQVNLIHVCSVSKNAADEKLRQSIRRFAEVHPPPATVVLISGDVNFASDLMDLRYRKKLHVILVHNVNVADALILCANEIYPYAIITDNLPSMKQKCHGYVDLKVKNLPLNCSKRSLKGRLSFLSDNCGGKVIEINNHNGIAFIRFTTKGFALRACHRLNGEDVFGNKIHVIVPESWHDMMSPRHYAGRRKMAHLGPNGNGFNAPPLPALGYPDDVYSSLQRDNFTNIRYNNGQDSRNTFRTTGMQEQRNSGRRGSFSRPNVPQPQTNTSVNANATNEHSRQIFYHSTSLSAANTPQIQQPVTPTVTPSSVELLITNLDPTIKDLRSYLTSLLKEYAMVYNLQVSQQADGAPVALARVSCQQDAQNIISHLHHFKLGYKRLAISYVQNNAIDPAHLRDMVISLLREAPSDRMPLYRLLNLLEQRYHTSVSVSEINKLKDVCRVSDEFGERIITLTPEIRSSPPSNIHRAQIMYCTVHCPNWPNPEYEALGNEATGPWDVLHVKMSLKSFTVKLNELLSSHMGTLPLLSFPVCYKYEFGEVFPVDSINGVPLEHLVTCVGNVELKYGGPANNMKYIRREVGMTSKPQYDSDKEEAFLRSLSPSISSSVTLLCRELVDLLKTAERCQLLLSKFIPAYHHHFGRQCRVADYGYTKLSDLLLSKPISNIVQVLGDGEKRLLTLTHTAQVRRFTSDLLRVLKAQASKQLTAAEFSSAYERFLGRKFSPVEYGLCQLEDLLDEMPESTVIVKRQLGDLTIAIPKREQTPVEVLRTKQFADEVVKLLSYLPTCSMLFNKFVPAYHHHFGHQCKVSDYGFGKLIELFEAIPDTVKINEMCDGERKITLTRAKALQLRGQQIAELIRRSQLGSLPLEALASAFLREYGFPLKPELLDCEDLDELVRELCDFVEVNHSSAGTLLVLVNNEAESPLGLRIWALLIQPPYSLNLAQLLLMYNTRYQTSLTVENIEHLNNVIITNTPNAEPIIFLTPPFVLGAQIYAVLYAAGGQLPPPDLESVYRATFGRPLLSVDAQGGGLERLLLEFSFLICLRRAKKRTTVILNQKLSEYGIALPAQMSAGSSSHSGNEEGVVSWLPPPIHELIPNVGGASVGRGITPPKPDTPPAAGEATWSNWETPQKYKDVDLSIPLPTFDTTKLVSAGGLESLISPDKNLLNAHTYPLSGEMPPLAPHPSDLPLPSKLIQSTPDQKKCLFGTDDSIDSGVNNSNGDADLSTTNAEQTASETHYVESKTDYISTCKV